MSSRHNNCARKHRIGSGAMERLAQAEPSRQTQMASGTFRPTASSIEGRRVLVTGAGGSIGSELVKQISRLRPSSLSLVDLNEFNLYQISHALEEDNLKFPWSASIGDIRDESAMSHLFMREKPDIVFHVAAALGGKFEKQRQINAIMANWLRFERTKPESPGTIRRPSRSPR